MFLLALVLSLASAIGEETCPADMPGCSSYASFDFEGWSPPKGFFGNQRDEVNNVLLSVKVGKVPQFLDGSLYRVGAALFDFGKGRRLNNLCDGLAKVHRWSISKETGEVRFSSKFLRSEIYNRSVTAQDMVATKLMGEADPPLTLLEKAQVLFWDSKNDNNNIAVWDLGKEGVTATSERPLYIDVDFDTLDFLKKFNPPSNDRSFFESEAMSASHFSKHPVTQHSINYKLVFPYDKGLFSGKDRPSYSMYEYFTDSSGEVVSHLIGNIPVTGPELRVVHSIGVSKNYVILPLFCMCLEMKDPTDIGANIIWDATRPTVMKILSIKDKSVQSFEFPAFEAQHNINSFERVNAKGELEVVTDFPTRLYPVLKEEITVYDLLNIDLFNNPEWRYANSPIDMNNRVRLTRFVMNTVTGESHAQDFPVMWNAPKDTSVEFPIINPNYRGQSYCYVYLQVWNNNFNNAMALMKVDLCQETSIGWEERNKFPVEPVFTARPGGESEDDGVIVAPVFDSTSNTTELYVWDAKNLEVLAIVSTPVVVPFTLHGVWINGV